MRAVALLTLLAVLLLTSWREEAVSCTGRRQAWPLLVAADAQPDSVRRRTRPPPRRKQRRDGFDPASTRLPRLYQSWEAPFDRVVRVLAPGKAPQMDHTFGLMRWDPVHNRSAVLSNQRSSIIQVGGRGYKFDAPSKCKEVALDWSPFTLELPRSAERMGLADPAKVNGHECAQWRDEEVAEEVVAEGAASRFTVTDYFVCRVERERQVKNCPRCAALLRREERVYEGAAGLVRSEVVTHRHWLPKTFDKEDFQFQVPYPCTKLGKKKQKKKQAKKGPASDRDGEL